MILVEALKKNMKKSTRPFYIKNFIYQFYSRSFALIKMDFLWQ